MLLGILIIISVNIILLYHSSIKRERFIINAGRELRRYSRTTKIFGFEDLFIVALCIGCIPLIAIKEEIIYVVLQTVFLHVIDKVKKIDEVVLLDDGMLFDRTYIEWQDVQNIYRSGDSSIRIDSSNFWFGQFTIKKLESAELVERDINRWIKSKNS